MDVSMDTIERIDVYENSDIYIHQNMVCNNGYSLEEPFERMVELAVEHECNLIVKAGRWYLKKGLHVPTVNFLLYNQSKRFYPNVTSYLIVRKEQN